MTGTIDESLGRSKFRSVGHVTIVSAESQQYVRIRVEAVDALVDHLTTVRPRGQPAWFGPESVRDDHRLILKQADEPDRPALEAILSEADYACRFSTGMAVVPPVDT